MFASHDIIKWKGYLWFLYVLSFVANKFQINKKNNSSKLFNVRTFCILNFCCKLNNISNFVNLSNFRKFKHKSYSKLRLKSGSVLFQVWKYKFRTIQNRKSRSCRSDSGFDLRNNNSTFLTSLTHCSPLYRITFGRHKCNNNNRIIIITHFSTI